jgi:hypothetical protein
MEGTIMTLEELRTAIEKERGLAFSSMRHLATADEKMLTAVWVSRQDKRRRLFWQCSSTTTRRSKR